MAKITISVTGTTVGDVSRKMTIEGDLSDALLGELVTRHGTDENGDARTPVAACEAALDGYLTSLWNIAVKKLSGAAAETAKDVVVSDAGSPTITSPSLRLA